MQSGRDASLVAMFRFLFGLYSVSDMAGRTHIAQDRHQCLLAVKLVIQA